MFDALMTMLRDLTGRDEADDGVVDVRLATAALMVHVVAIDGATTVSERETMRGALMKAFKLSGGRTDALIAEARRLDLEAVDLTGFTAVINRRLELPARERLIEILWELVYSDGLAQELEDDIIWRIADLLGVSSTVRLRLKKRIAATARGT
ncbi:tellurite resistance TerB family protein [Methylobrevis albus]|uniref:TerB family tellurite resistance protein n=1 Tax=Methylobrevis albus TaxID=2793297 RepID=A0A931I1E2_9HYPH|nr:TerB family tellurite resistance protein [Methylobrevis albus]MBH0237186.1 TerB family tellurite resistance protein [Methylobrevis albus]